MMHLRNLARAHSNDMFKRGYFSHYTPEGLSPFDRMEKAGINYQYAGENLALAPSTDSCNAGTHEQPRTSGKYPQSQFPSDWYRGY